MKKIDLNADMGEYADDAQAEAERAIMGFISSCSIACGGHAGDAETMRRTVRLAKENNVSIGAHPSYPDRENFGRTRMTIELDVLAASIQEQIASLKTILEEEGAPMRHVKPHGALYNTAANDLALAEIIAEATDGAILVGSPNSALEEAARNKGVAFAPEGFIDRLYLPSGALTPRSEPGAVIESIDARVAQASALANGKPIALKDGEITLSPATLCIHSDSAGAVETADAVRARLIQDGFSITPFE